MNNLNDDKKNDKFCDSNIDNEKFSVIQNTNENENEKNTNTNTNTNTDSDDNNKTNKDEDDDEIVWIQLYKMDPFNPFALPSSKGIAKSFNTAWKDLKLIAEEYAVEIIGAANFIFNQLRDVSLHDNCSTTITLPNFKTVLLKAYYNEKTGRNESILVSIFRPGLIYGYSLKHVAIFGMFPVNKHDNIHCLNLKNGQLIFSESSNLSLSNISKFLSSNCNTSIKNFHSDLSPSLSLSSLSSAVYSDTIDQPYKPNKEFLNELIIAVKKRREKLEKNT